MAIPKPVPLYPTYKELKDVRLDEFPDLAVLLSDTDPWKPKAWLWGQEFLSYIGRNKPNTHLPDFAPKLKSFCFGRFSSTTSP